MDSEQVHDPTEDIAKQERPMIFAVTKVGRPEHLEGLADGKIWCRQLSYYKRIEGERRAYNDGHEGLIGIYQSDQVRLKFGDIMISSETGLTGQVLIIREFESPVFCMYAIHSGRFTKRQMTDADLPEYRRALEIPKRMTSFGSHVWIVMDGPEFNKRLFGAAKRAKIAVRHGLVRYLSRLGTHGSVPEDRAGFVKLSDFEHEQEYRFMFESATPLPDPFILDVGSLRDISKVVPFEEFNSQIDVKPPKD